MTPNEDGPLLRRMARLELLAKARLNMQATLNDLIVAVLLGVYLIFLLPPH